MFINSVADITVTRIISVNRLLNSPVGVTTNRYDRPCWAVVLKSGGRTYYTVNGRQILSDRFHPVILPRGCNYSWTCLEAGECITVEFDALCESDGIMVFKINDNTFMTSAIERLEKCLHLQSQSSSLECKHLLYGMLATLSKSGSRDYLPSDKRMLLEPAVSYITKRYFDSGITNEILATLCGISAVYFRKTFESVYGVSPIKYLNSFRMEKAKAILKSDYSSIEQVAISVGYNSIYHFSKMFKAYTGISPTEYAKASRK